MRASIPAFLAILGAATTSADTHRDLIAPFFADHCVKCHGPEKQKAKLTLHDLATDVSSAAETWEDVYDMLSLGEMPPEDEPRPDKAAVTQVADWIRTGLVEAGRAPRDKRDHPAFGNYVDHDALFNETPRGVPMPPPRLWRIRPDSYDSNIQQVAKGKDTTPFTLDTGSGGFADYAHLYKLDEGTLGLLLGNATAAAGRMTAHKIEGGKAVRDGWSAPNQFLELLHPGAEPTDEQLNAAIDWQFGRVLLRAPSEEERARMLAFFRQGIANNGALLALRNMIAAVLLSPEALYRAEIGSGEPDRHGRRRLGGRELAFALAYTLTDARPRGELLKAAEDGALDDGEGLAGQIERMLADEKLPKPRILGFFREYFGYPGARAVFKDQELFPQHRADILVSDTDRLVRHILAEDQDVFRRLLTTSQSFVNYRVDNKRGPIRAERQRMVHLSYNLPPDWKFAPQQPIELPAGQRAGILTQPSWLVAMSGNFENHIIHRGKWIRERLLGGTIPDLPITVDAQLPDEPHEPLRHRMRVTREAECWRCHERMNPLGNTFENFDHFGRWRAYEIVQDREATAANVDSKGKPRGEISRRIPFDSAGLIAGSGDPKLDGGVGNSIDMIHKLAASDRCRQVFIRHVFRYFLGRNETLDDASTLQQADRVYLDSGGSFNALLVSLLTSDSFATRATPNE